MLRKRLANDPQRVAECFHLPRAGHALTLPVAAQREQADACSVRQLLLCESTDEAHLLQGLAEAPALRASEKRLARSLPIFDLLSAPTRSTSALDCGS